MGEPRRPWAENGGAPDVNDDLLAYVRFHGANDVIDAVLEAGMKPFVTLQHFTNPRWFAEAGGWLDDGARFAIVLAGSSSCPAFPSSIDVADPHTIKLGLDTRGGPNCTADMAPRTYIIRTPTGIDSSGQVTLLFGETTVALPPL